MRRLLAAIRVDFLTQARRLTPQAGPLGLLAAWYALGRYEPAAVLLLLQYLLAFQFACVIFWQERAQGVFARLSVTPLRPHEYLGAKLLLLGLYSTVHVLLACYLARLPVQPLLLAAGGLSAAALFVLAAFLALSARSLPPAKLAAVTALSLPLLLLPLLPAASAARPWILLHPVEAPLTLIRAAFAPAAPWQIVYGFLCSGAWAAALFVLAKGASARLREA